MFGGNENLNKIRNTYRHLYLRRAREYLMEKNINVQIIQVPTIFIGASVIAALELLYPDEGNDNKKNDACQPISPPQITEEFFSIFYTSNQNLEKIVESLGM